MKAILSAVAVALLAFPLIAETSDQDHQKREKSRMNLCKVFSDTAENIMMQRQGGLPMSEMMEIAEYAPPLAAEMKKNLTIQAFKIERERTPEGRKRAIERMKNQSFLDCYEAYEME